MPHSSPASGPSRKLLPSEGLEYLNALVERLPVGIGIVDQAGRTQSLNPAGLHLHGFASLDEMFVTLEQYRDVFELRYPDGRMMPPEEWPLARALRGELVRDYEVRLRRKWDHEDKIVSYSGVPVPDGPGGVGRVIFVMHDVTQRRQAEDELRRTKALLEGITRGTDELIAAEDRHFRYIFFNDAYRREFRKLWGKDLGLGTSMVEALTPWPDDRQRAMELWQRALSGESFNAVAEFGDLRQVYDLRFYPIYDTQGQLLGAAHILRNVTDRFRMEEALRASEARYRALVESQSEMLCRFRADGTILFANRAYATARNTTPEQLLGRNLWDFIPVEDHAGIRQMLDRLRPESPEVRIENRFKASDGIRWTLWTNRALEFDSGGRFVEAQSTGIDITDRRRAEELLKDGDRRKDEFLATLAHELRNPLAPIRNAIQVLRLTDGRTEASDEALQIMDRQLAHMVRLIDDLLDVSRITRGKIQLRSERLRLADVLKNAIESVQPLIDDCNHRLSVQLPNEAVYLDGDPARLAQVFANLLANACKYTERGGRISVDAERQPGIVVIKIRDNGIGIAAEHLGHLFQMFSQVTPAIERSQGGLGIGLSLVKGLVELHQGTVEARSGGPGRGSEFLVTLPVAGTRSDSADESDGAAQPSNAGACRVLVVDDNRDSVYTLAILLRIKGHDVQIAHDGDEAIRLAGIFRPKVILLDIGMPKKNGYEVAREIRLFTWGRQVQLVAMTGWGQDEDKRRALEAGFDYHLTKPVDPAILDQILRHVMADAAPTPPTGPLR